MSDIVREDIETIIAEDNNLYEFSRNLAKKYFRVLLFYKIEIHGISCPARTALY